MPGYLLYQAGKPPADQSPASTWTGPQWINQGSGTFPRLPQREERGQVGPGEDLTVSHPSLSSVVLFLNYFYPYHYYKV